MIQIAAVYQNGVFRPLVPVDLPENQQVQLDVKLVETVDMLEWFEMVRERKQQYIEKHGYLPDSTPDIREDRMR